MINSLLLIASSFWVDIGVKQAIVCDINQIQACLKQLDKRSLQRLPVKIKRYREMMGLRHAMVIPINDTSTAGLILINPRETPTETFAIVRNTALKLPLFQQRQLSLWHEQGHLINRPLFASLNQPHISGYQHEWLADLYLLWKSVQATKSTNLAWQQLHRRNIDIINNPINLNHWSSPFLLQVLQKLSTEQILSFSTYNEFFKKIVPKLKPLERDQQTEIHNLVRFLFDNSSTRDLPNYLYWRRPKLTMYLQPTFVHILGNKQAAQLMSKLNLSTSSLN